MGNTAYLHCKFWNPRSGQRVEPTTVTCKVLPPNTNTPTVLPVVSLGSGEYEARADLTVPGVWTYRFEGTGANKAAFEGRLSVRESRF